jgi:hypothetical protein
MLGGLFVLFLFVCFGALALVALAVILIYNSLVKLRNRC